MAIQYLYAAGAVAAVAGTVMGALAGRSAAASEAYQMKLAAEQARLEGENTALDLHRGLRYTQGMALASLGHTSGGIGESFLAVRSDEFNLYARNLTNARLSSVAQGAGLQAAGAAARARGRNAMIGGFFDAVALGVQGFKDYKALRPSSTPAPAAGEG